MASFEGIFDPYPQQYEKIFKFKHNSANNTISFYFPRSYWYC